MALVVWPPSPFVFSGRSGTVRGVGGVGGLACVLSTRSASGARSSRTSAGGRPATARSRPSASSSCSAILVAVNYLSTRQNKRWDLTANQPVQPVRADGERQNVASDNAIRLVTMMFMEFLDAGSLMSPTGRRGRRASSRSSCPPPSTCSARRHPAPCQDARHGTGGGDHTRALPFGIALGHPPTRRCAAPPLASITEYLQSLLYPCSVHLIGRPFHQAADVDWLSGGQLSMESISAAGKSPGWPLRHPAEMGFIEGADHPPVKFQVELAGAGQSTSDVICRNGTRSGAVGAGGRRSSSQTAVWICSRWRSSEAGRGGCLSQLGRPSCGTLSGHAQYALTAAVYADPSLPGKVA